MERKLRNRGERPQAFIGALIGAAGSLVGSIINANAQKRQAEEQARLQREAQAREEAKNMTTALNLTENAQKAYEDQFRINFKCGGRRKLKNGGHGYYNAAITDGGYAIPIDNDTFLLRGSSHEDVNESGNTGIGIKVYKKGGSTKRKGEEIEAEGGEVIQEKPNEVRIFSDTLRLPNGMTFAEAAAAGYNKDELFALQQQMNGGYSISPVEKRKKAPFGAQFGTADYIGLGTNVLGSVLSKIYSRRMYNNLEKYAPERPALYNAGKLITNYNINPQLSNLELQRQQAYRSIDRDVSNSAAANDRRNTIALQTALAQNELYNTKYGKEAELMNKDILNQQEVANKNVEEYNKWKNDRQSYLAGIALNRDKSTVDMIQGIGNSIGGFLQQGIDNYQAEQAISAEIAKSPYGTAERMASLGFNFRRGKMKQFLADATNRLELYKDDNSEAGIKAYNNALESYLFWNNALGKNPSSNYKRRSLANPSVGNLIGSGTPYITIYPSDRGTI